MWLHIAASSQHIHHKTVMAYNKGTTTTLKSSASLLANNLSVLTGLEGDSTTLAVAHKGSINIVHAASGVSNLEEVFYDESKTSKDPASYLTGAMWCQLQSLRVVLIMTSFKGFQILEWNGGKQLYLNRFDTPEGSFASRFARGIASVGNYVCIGTSEGPILMLSVPAQTGDVKFIKQLQAHSSPICALATNEKGRLASCDERGVIVVWLDPITCDDTFAVINDSNDVPCQCLCFWKYLLIGGFSNGLIKIYNSDTSVKMVEIAAHARCINALDVALQAGLLLSASEDSTVSVWELPTDEEPNKVSLVYSTVVPNSVLCGGRFIGPSGTRLAVSSFDSTELLTFTKS